MLDLSDITNDLKYERRPWPYIVGGVPPYVQPKTFFMQLVFLSGNLVSNAETIASKDPKGGDFMRFTVAVKDRQGDRDEATYYACRMRKSGVLQYLTKGRSVCLAGTLSISKVEKDGKTYVNNDVWVSHLDLGSAKNGASSSEEDLPE